VAVDAPGCQAVRAGRDSERQARQGAGGKRKRIESNDRFLVFRSGPIGKTQPGLRSWRIDHIAAASANVVPANVLKRNPASAGFLFCTDVQPEFAIPRDRDPGVS
jgi:hypothetical protein